MSPETYRTLTAQCVAEQGDILYTAVGATFGRAVGSWAPFVFQRHIALLKLVAHSILPGYAEPLLNSPSVFSQARLAAREQPSQQSRLGICVDSFFLLRRCVSRA